MSNCSIPGSSVMQKFQEVDNLSTSGYCPQYTHLLHGTQPNICGYPPSPSRLAALPYPPANMSPDNFPANALLPYSSNFVTPQEFGPSPSSTPSLGSTCCHLTPLLLSLRPPHRYEPSLWKRKELESSRNPPPFRQSRIQKQRVVGSPPEAEPPLEVSNGSILISRTKDLVSFVKEALQMLGEIVP